ncbi:MAG TPA: HSP20 family small heat-shock protein [Polyangiaceae bacterium]
MANIAVTKENGNRPVPNAPVREAWEPFRMLRELMRWDPFAEMTPAFSGEGAAFAPAFDVKESKDAFIFKADLPGIKESDIDVKLTQNRLSIAGKREAEKSDKGETYYSYERSYGSFTRTFTLPDGVDTDNIKAVLKDGVLTLELPKKPEHQPKTIAVKSS